MSWTSDLHLESLVSTKRHSMAASSSATLPPAGFLDLISQDPRPTVTLDISDFSSAPINENAAFVDFCESVRTSQGTKSFILSSIKQAQAHALGQQFSAVGHQWTSFVVDGRWRIFACANNMPVEGLRSSGRSTVSLGLSGSSANLSALEQDSTTPSLLPGAPSKNLDWTSSPTVDMTDYVRFFREYDWSSTSMGPMEEWSPLYRRLIVSAMCNPDPRIILWGKDLIMTYNEACVPLIGHKHPHSLGRPPSFTFAELWEAVMPYVTQTMEKGQSVRANNILLTIDRAGFLEDTYWDFTFIPVLGEDGRAVGLIDEFFESTFAVVNERRLNTVLKIGEGLTEMVEISAVWRQILSALDKNLDDIPFALLYSVDEDNSDDSTSSISKASSSPSGLSASARSCTLEGTVGIEKDNPAATNPVSLTENKEYASLFHTAAKMKRPLLLSTGDGTLPSNLQIAVEGRASGAPCERAVVCPIQSLANRNVFAYLILGIHARRAFDEDYEHFVQFLTDRITNVAAAVFLPVEQRQIQAAADAAAASYRQLSRQLLLRTQEAESSQAKFMRMAQDVPVGMYIFRPDGNPVYLNEKYHEMTGVPHEWTPVPDTDDPYRRLWSDTVHPEDLHVVEKHWLILSKEKRPATFEYRLKRPWKTVDRTTGTDIIGDCWILVNAYPEFNDDGSVRTVNGWISDISLQKWTENMQARQLQEALEMKRQHENFIDMTSHEMRNPLSAIIQCADGMLTNIEPYRASESRPDTPSMPSDEIENSVDLCQTIILCAQHQKRIVDDVLTLSKLDSDLMMIAPDRVRPVSLVHQALKMYEAEFQNALVEYNLVVDSSYAEMPVDEVVLDPSRLLQILINLITNAIKFTRDQDKKAVTIYLGASSERPSETDDGIIYTPKRTGRPPVRLAPEWGSGSEVFLQFAVRDTGAGISPEELTSLFQRFAQASATTYKHHGGSGLGLYISKELAELQDGQIGVRSKRGEGSTFAFYIRALQYEPKHAGADTQELHLSHNPVFLAQAPRKISSRDVKQRPDSKQSAPSTSGRSIITAAAMPQKEKELLTEPKKKPLHVLVVEDNIINQRVTAQQLQRAGCEVQVANHGGEALDILTQSVFAKSSASSESIPSLRPNAPRRRSSGVVSTKPTGQPPPKELSIILMDWEMPVMDGLTCIKRIREMQRTGELVRHVPVIAVTAKARNEQLATALAAGMDLVVTKPFRIPELIPQMQRLIAKQAAGPTSPVYIQTEKDDDSQRI